MKKRLLVAFVVLVAIVGLAGCQSESSIPQITSTVQGYNNKIVSKIIEKVLAENLTSSINDIWSGNDKISLGDDSLRCVVSEVSTDNLHVIVTISQWVADDGTEVSGKVDCDIDFTKENEASEYHVSYIDNDGFLYYDRVAASYNMKWSSDSSIADFDDLDCDGVTFSYLTSDGNTFINIDSK